MCYFYMFPFLLLFAFINADDMIITQKITVTRDCFFPSGDTV